VSHAAWHFVVDADGVPAVAVLYDKDSLLAFQGGWYECVDRLAKPFVPAPGLLYSDDFKGKLTSPREVFPAHHREASNGHRYKWIVGQRSSFATSTGRCGRDNFWLVDDRDIRV